MKTIETAAKDSEVETDVAAEELKLQADDCQVPIQQDQQGEKEDKNHHKRVGESGPIIPGKQKPDLIADQTPSSSKEDCGQPFGPLIPIADPNPAANGHHRQAKPEVVDMETAANQDNVGVKRGEGPGNQEG
ncbi:MAG: hypothetical protein ACUVQM_01015 [Candidatus Hadarchaeaceae archaeon]